MTSHVPTAWPQSEGGGLTGGDDFSWTAGQPFPSLSSPGGTQGAFSLEPASWARPACPQGRRQSWSGSTEEDGGPLSLSRTRARTNAGLSPVSFGVSPPLSHQSLGTTECPESSLTSVTRCRVMSENEEGERAHPELPGGGALGKPKDAALLATGSSCFKSAQPRPALPSPCGQKGPLHRLVRTAGGAWPAARLPGNSGPGIPAMNSGLKRGF